MSVCIDRLLRRLVANSLTRLIKVGGVPYLARVYLWYWRGGWVYLHRFILPGGDRQLHDHPFHAMSVVLPGGYRKERLVALDIPAPELSADEVLSVIRTSRR